jgi:hypothetical protein
VSAARRGVVVRGHQEGCEARGGPLCFHGLRGTGRARRTVRTGRVRERDGGAASAGARSDAARPGRRRIAPLGGPRAAAAPTAPRRARTPPTARVWRGRGGQRDGRGEARGRRGQLRRGTGQPGSLLDASVLVEVEAAGCHARDHGIRPLRVSATMDEHGERAALGFAPRRAQVLSR